MKHLPALIVLMMYSVNSHPVFADTEFVDSVPLEVVKQFVGNPYMGQSALYSDILDAFPPFTVPADFEVLASADQGFVQRVILSSTLDEAGASAALTQAFIAEGWSQIPINGMPAQQTGFVSAEQPVVVPQQLCHDDHGMLTASVRDDGGKRYININRNLSGQGIRPTCAEMLAQAAQGYSGMGFRRGGMLDTYAPKLIMPESNMPTRPTAFMGGGGGGSSNDWESRGALTIDWEIGDIYEHFASQIGEQGWLADSDASGGVVATGSWTKSVDDVNLVGMLSIIKLAENTWDMRFRIVRQGGAAGGLINSRIIREAVQ